MTDLDSNILALRSFAERLRYLPGVHDGHPVANFVRAYLCAAEGVRLGNVDQARIDLASAYHFVSRPVPMSADHAQRCTCLYLALGAIAGF